MEAPTRPLSLRRHRRPRPPRPDAASLSPDATAGRGHRAPTRPPVYAVILLDSLTCARTLFRWSAESVREPPHRLHRRHLHRLRPHGLGRCINQGLKGGLSQLNHLLIAPPHGNRTSAGRRTLAPPVLPMDGSASSGGFSGAGLPPRPTVSTTRHRPFVAPHSRAATSSSLDANLPRRQELPSPGSDGSGSRIPSPGSGSDGSRMHTTITLVLASYNYSMFN
ncbi:uncharacterized protein LOC110434543 isoform X2 [Sorghum bicolor]|uniref:uncharacterized protein LOC110434543 isoform X2 n=1 Tax=Sorghum bicolor TaxID=4558 RepID=UPI000B426B9F|nr:uncharacterized protein LOC110434543 isoform X2 [Sorghum bicolor]|eukprot:XP_021314428.1 uncharacterized protein LOC110434543 isoform X2 [Sorghum bicolor]